MPHEMSAYVIPADSGFWQMLFLDWHFGPTFHGIFLWVLVSLVAALPLLIAALLVRSRRARGRSPTRGERRTKSQEPEAG